MGTFVPAEFFPPGEIIREELEARGWTQGDLAEIMGRPVQTVNEIISAKKRVTAETARELEQALAIDAEIWVRTEAMYRLQLTKAAPAAIARRAALRKRLPLSQTVARGWIPASDDVDQQEAHVLEFTRCAKLEDRAPLAMAARQTAYNQPVTAVQEVWLLRVQQIAETMHVAQYSEDTLLRAIEELRTLLRHPDDARHVPRILGEAGVRFVVVEQLPGLKTDGVCFWLANDKPVIGMSLVRDRIDNFWFTLRHECEHVLNGDGKAAAIVDNDLDKSVPAESAEERKANVAAAEFCVPQDELADFLIQKGPVYSDAAIRQFAHRIARHPGLVAGQLRRRLDAWNLYTRHLARIRHVILDTAVVDGFGSTPLLGPS